MKNPVTDDAVTVVLFEPVRVAVLEHRGSHDRLDESVARFIEWRKSSGLAPLASSRTFGVAHNDPETTQPEQFRWDICAEVKQSIPENPQGVISGEIPGGRCARFRHIGSHEQLGEKVRFLRESWLPASGERQGNFPCFLYYLNPGAPEDELLTDIYLPLQ